jgi:hypothetical protein
MKAKTSVSTLYQTDQTKIKTGKRAVYSWIQEMFTDVQYCVRRVGVGGGGVGRHQEAKSKTLYN